jgi:hypothetical protein
MPTDVTTGDFSFASMSLGVGILCSLFVAWLLLGTYALDGRDAARGLDRRWWWLAAGAASVCVFATVMNQRSAQFWSIELGLGAIFVPTYIHLVADVWCGPSNNQLERTRS